MVQSMVKDGWSDGLLDILDAFKKLHIWDLKTQLNVIQCIGDNFDLTQWRDRRKYYLVLVNAILRPLNRRKLKLGGAGREIWSKEPGGRRGNIVLVKSKDFLGNDSNTGKHGHTAHPAIVVFYDSDLEIVHVAPIGHKHPGPHSATLDAALVGIRPTDCRRSLISLSRPKRVYIEDVKPLGTPRPGCSPLPKRLENSDFFLVLENLAAHSNLCNGYNT